MPAKDGSKPKRRLRPKIGDLLEFQTAKGLGYAQYTHRFDDKFYRDLIRVIEGLFDERPADLEALAARPTLFWVYFPVASEAWRGTLTLLGPVTIPPEAREKPAMRSTLGEAMRHRPGPGASSMPRDGTGSRPFRRASGNYRESGSPSARA